MDEQGRQFRVNRDKPRSEPWPWWGGLILAGMACATVITCGLGWWLNR